VGRRAGAVVCALQLEAGSADDEQAHRPAEDLEDLVTQTNRKTNMANEQTSGGLLPHGEMRRYRSGCRCPDCRRANAQDQADYRRRLKIGAVRRRPPGHMARTEYVPVRMEADLAAALDAAAAAAGTSRSATIRAALRRFMGLPGGAQ